MYRNTCCNNKETIKCCPSSIIKVTYDDLIELITTNRLMIGFTYLIKDYQYKYTNLVTDVYGPVEPLYVNAISNNTLSNVAVSYYYPGDIIDYNVFGSYKGTILSRS